MTPRSWELEGQRQLFSDRAPWPLVVDGPSLAPGERVTVREVTAGEGLPPSVPARESVVADRDRWIRLFNRLQAAVARHEKSKAPAFADEVDEGLWHAHRQVFKAAAERGGRDSRPVAGGEGLYSLSVQKLRDALLLAADDLDKAANQFESMRQSQEAGYSPGVVVNPRRFAEKAERARKAAG